LRRNRRRHALTTFQPKKKTKARWEGGMFAKGAGERTKEGGKNERSLGSNTPPPRRGVWGVGGGSVNCAPHIQKQNKKAKGKKSSKKRNACPKSVSLSLRAQRKDGWGVGEHKGANGKSHAGGGSRTHQKKMANIAKKGLSALNQNERLPTTARENPRPGVGRGSRCLQQKHQMRLIWFTCQLILSHRTWKLLASGGGVMQNADKKKEVKKANSRSRVEQSCMSRDYPLYPVVTGEACIKKKKVLGSSPKEERNTQRN